MYNGPPLVEGEKARGRTAVFNSGILRFERRRIKVLPLFDVNPFTLARLVPGVVLADVISLRLSRSFDHGLTFTPGVTGGVLNASS